MGKEKIHSLGEEILPFRDGLFIKDEDGSGFLIANKCQHCNTSFFPKRDSCTECYGNDQLKDIKLSTRGTLHTFSVVYRSTPNFKTPYIIGYIDLEHDGVRIFAPITGCKPEDLSVDMDMELVFDKTNRLPKDESDNRLLTYKFRPSK